MMHGQKNIKPCVGVCQLLNQPAKYLFERMKRFFS